MELLSTFHRKGPVDGISVSVKRQLWTAVSRRTSLVNNATFFTTDAREVCNVNRVEMTLIKKMLSSTLKNCIQVINSVLK